MLTFAAAYDELEASSIYDVSVMRDICASIEEYKAKIEYSNEAQTLLTVLDYFGRIFNTLTTSITKFTKSVKRGELKKYCDDHAATVHKIESLNIDSEIFQVDIDVPTGMTTSYKDAAIFLNTLFNDLDLRSLLTNIKSTLKQFCSNVHRNHDVTVQVGAFAAAMNGKKSFVARMAAEMEKRFSGKGSAPTRPFTKEFKSVGELRSTKDAILQVERYLESVASISKLTDDITAIISDIESNKDATVISSVASSLSDSAETLAKTIDLFGMGILNLMSLSHNYTLIYNKLRQKV